jgi:hypothetical protein
MDPSIRLGILIALLGFLQKSLPGQILFLKQTYKAISG